MNEQEDAKVRAKDFIHKVQLLTGAFVYDAMVVKGDRKVYDQLIHDVESAVAHFQDMLEFAIEDYDKGSK